MKLKIQVLLTVILIILKVQSQNVQSDLFFTVDQPYITLNYNDQIYNLCIDNFNFDTAQKICQYKGYKTFFEYSTNIDLGYYQDLQDDSLHFSSFECDEDQQCWVTDIDNCSIKDIVANVQCLDGELYTLQNKQFYNDFGQDNLLIFIDDVWGQVCDYNFNKKKASFICHQLGYDLVKSLETGQQCDSEDFSIFELNCNKYNGCYDKGFPQGQQCNINNCIKLSCENFTLEDFKFIDSNKQNSQVTNQIQAFSHNKWRNVCSKGIFGLNTFQKICIYQNYNNFQNIENFQECLDQETKFYSRYISCFENQKIMNLDNCSGSKIQEQCGINDCINIQCSNDYQENMIFLQKYDQIQQNLEILENKNLIQPYVYINTQWYNICIVSDFQKISNQICQDKGYLSAKNVQTTFQKDITIGQQLAYLVEDEDGQYQVNYKQLEDNENFCDYILFECSFEPYVEIKITPNPNCDGEHCYFKKDGEQNEGEKNTQNDEDGEQIIIENIKDGENLQKFNTDGEILQNSSQNETNNNKSKSENSENEISTNEVSENSLTEKESEQEQNSSNEIDNIYDGENLNIKYHKDGEVCHCKDGEHNQNKIQMIDGEDAEYKSKNRKDGENQIYRDGEMEDGEGQIKYQKDSEIYNYNDGEIQNLKDGENNESNISDGENGEKQNVNNINQQINDGEKTDGEQIIYKEGKEGEYDFESQNLKQFKNGKWQNICQENFSQSDAKQQCEIQGFQDSLIEQGLICDKNLKNQCQNNCIKLQCLNFSTSNLKVSQDMDSYLQLFFYYENDKKMNICDQGINTLETVNKLCQHLNDNNNYFTQSIDFTPINSNSNFNLYNLKYEAEQYYYDIQSQNSICNGVSSIQCEIQNQDISNQQQYYIIDGILVYQQDQQDKFIILSKPDNYEEFDSQIGQQICQNLGFKNYEKLLLGNRRNSLQYQNQYMTWDNDGQLINVKNSSEKQEISIKCNNDVEKSKLQKMEKLLVDKNDKQQFYLQTYDQDGQIGVLSSDNFGGYKTADFICKKQFGALTFQNFKKFECPYKSIQQFINFDCSQDGLQNTNDCQYDIMNDNNQQNKENQCIVLECLYEEQDDNKEIYFMNDQFNESGALLARFQNNDWGYVCQENFSASQAQFVCQQNGYKTYNHFNIKKKCSQNNKSKNESFSITKMSCEMNGNNCTYTQKNNKQCNIINSCVTLQCQDQIQIEQLRTNKNGIVQVKSQNIWKFLCMNNMRDYYNFGLQFCQNINKKQGLESVVINHECLTDQKYWIDSLQCQNNEYDFNNNLNNCDMRWKPQGCINKCLQINCQPESLSQGQIINNNDVMLISDRNKLKNICIDSKIEINEQQVICRQQGFNNVVGISDISCEYSSEYFYDFKCVGTEQSVFDCEINMNTQQTCNSQKCLKVECNNIDIDQKDNSKNNTENNNNNNDNSNDKQNNLDNNKQDDNDKIKDLKDDQNNIEIIDTWDGEIKEQEQKNNNKQDSEQSIINQAADYIKSGLNQIDLQVDLDDLVLVIITLIIPIVVFIVLYLCCKKCCCKQKSKKQGALRFNDEDDIEDRSQNQPNIQMAELQDKQGKKKSKRKSQRKYKKEKDQQQIPQMNYPQLQLENNDDEDASQNVQMNDVHFDTDMVDKTMENEDLSGRIDNNTNSSNNKNSSGENDF